MNRFRRIRSGLEAAEGEGSKPPPPGAQGTPQVRSKSTNARSSTTTPRPRPNTAKTEPQPISPISNTRYGPAPKPTPRFTKSDSLQVPPESPGARPGDGEILIALMGVSGSGKSYFCRAATGDGDIHAGDGLEPCTRKPTAHLVMLPTDSGETHVTLIDTPGFSDSMRNDVEVLTGIADELREAYKQNRKFSGVLYFHRISDLLEGSAIKQLGVFRELCGDDSGMPKNVILVTNRWDRLESVEVGIKRQVELEKNPRFWKPMCLKGSQVMRFEGTTESALQLIRLLVHKTPLPLKIQQEMVDENKPLGETGAGRFVGIAIDKRHKEHEHTLAAIKYEMQLALREEDEGMQMLLKEESGRSKTVIDELRKQQDLMKADTEEAISEEWERMKNEMEQREQRQRDERDLNDAGYDPQIGQKSATTGLSDAVRKRRDLRIIRLLLDKDANPTACITQPRFSHRSALHVAAEVGYADAIGVITETLNDATELDTPDSYGDTALSWASSNGREAVVKMLLAKGASPNTVNKFGRSPLILAAKFGNEEAVRLLLEERAKLDITDNDADSALTCAARNGYEAIVRLLLKSGAKHDIRNIHGETALSLATEKGHVLVVRLLHAHAARVDLEVTPFATGS